MCGVKRDWFVPGSCGDGVKNNDEINVDCGGTLCPPCPTEVYCLYEALFDAHYVRAMYVCISRCVEMMVSVKRVKCVWDSTDTHQTSSTLINTN